MSTCRAEDEKDEQAAKKKAGSFKGTEKTAASPPGKGQESGEKAGQKIIQKEKVGDWSSQDENGVWSI